MHIFAIPKKRILQTFWNGSRFLQSTLTRKKASAKTTLPRSAPTTTEALLIVQGLAYVNENMGDEKLHAKVP